MAKEKPNLAAALARREENAKEQEIKTVSKTESVKASAPKSRSDRSDQVNISGWFSKSVKFTLDELRLKRQRELGRRVTIQELMGEAYNDLFKKYGFPEVAPTKEE